MVKNSAEANGTEHFNINGYSATIGDATFTTGGTAPTPPPQISATVIASTEVDISFGDAPAEGVTAFLDAYWLNVAPGNWYPSIDGDTCRIIGLSPNTTYYFSTGFDTETVKATTLATSGSSVQINSLQFYDQNGNALSAAELGPDGQPRDGFFLIDREGGDLNVPLTVDLATDTSAADSATPGYEYQALPSTVTFAAYQSWLLVPVTPNEINHVEGTTTVTATITPNSDYYVYDGDESSATVSITNTDTPLGISFQAPTDAEGYPIVNLDNGTDSLGQPYLNETHLASPDPDLVAVDLTYPQVLPPGWSVTLTTNTSKMWFFRRTRR